MKFTEDKIFVLCRNLEQQMVIDTTLITQVVYQECGYKNGHQPPEQGYRKFEKGTRLDGINRHYWFRMQIQTPEISEGHLVFLSVITGREGQWDATNPQGLVYLNGEIAQGLDVNHTEMLLQPKTSYHVDLYFYTGMQGGEMDFSPYLKVIDSRIEKLYLDIWVPFTALNHLDKDSQDYIDTIKCLDRAANIVQMNQQYSPLYYDSLKKAQLFMQDAFYHGICGKNNQIVDCVGHTHIDVAWLWTLAQTKEKAQRSFATVLRLMDEYPEYRFMASQPQLYEYVKEEAPKLYEKIKNRVRDERWEPEGAMWLEADCNLPSGESLVRQIMHGKKFLNDEFGVDSRILWLPDVFGYSAALPQILKKSGIQYFVTSKISWNDTNSMPYDSFLWEGLDGSEIFTNLLTTQEMPENGTKVNYVNYNGDITPSWIKGTYQRFHHKEYTDRVLNAFGFGDGGGGPTRKMLEIQRRMAFGLPGYPKTEMSSLANHLDLVWGSFKENAKNLQRTPHWTGELYLEYHRGTYTSMAQNKKNNRNAEFFLQKLEAMACICSIMANKAYPAEELNNLWSTVLKNQFHDIIPGSSIQEVYEDSEREYAMLNEQFDKLQNRYFETLAQQIGPAQGILVYNPLGFARCGTIMLNDKTVEIGEIPALGWRVISDEQISSEVIVSHEERKIENHAYILHLDENGCINSLFDKRYERDVLQPGTLGNELQLFEDFSKDFDAWELSPFYKEKPVCWNAETEIAPIFDGARAGFCVRKKYQASIIEQKIFLYNTLNRIDFETQIIWNEEHHVLKAAFPVNVHATMATYEIQFGNLQRPTYVNTQWDAAKFEVCGHKWADISEGNYGVSILNDGKYGWNTEGSVLKLTLLKCATYPNPHADKGLHTFTYSLLPHAGDYRKGETVREAYSLNQPFICRPIKTNKGALSMLFSFVSCRNSNIVVETVKQAESGDAIIIRLYDAHDCKVNGILDFGFDFEKAYICDLLENEIQELEVDGRSIQIPVHNFEIVTIKLTGAVMCNERLVCTNI